MEQLIMAIETGGTKIQLAIGTAQGDILYNHHAKVEREKGFRGVLDVVTGIMPELMEKAREFGGKIEKIGIGFGGPVDMASGTAIWSPQIDGWGGFPVKKYFEEKTGLPTYLYNDSGAACWGEYNRGAGRGSEIFFYTNMGSGVGGGVVIDGKLFTGQGYGAAEIGHSYLYNPFYKSGESPVMQVENLCAGWGIESRMRKDDIPKSSVLWELCKGEQHKIDCLMWGEGIRQNDTYSIKVLDETCEFFSIALSNVICLFSPDTIAIGGGVSLIGEPLISRINDYIKKYIYINSRGRYKIVKSELDEAVVLVGGLLLAGRAG